MNIWNFDQSEYWWDVASRSVRFDGVRDGKRYVFAISVYWGTEDIFFTQQLSCLNNISSIPFFA